MKDSSYLLALAANEETEGIARDTWRDYDRWVDQWGNITD